MDPDKTVIAISEGRDYEWLLNVFKNISSFSSMNLFLLKLGIEGEIHLKMVYAEF